jgi:dehydrogenase/reductase SDR family protein 7B
MQLNNKIIMATPSYLQVLSSLGVIALFYRLMRYLRTMQSMRTFFKNKKVLITGASGGLGKALAEELYPLGAQLILCARNMTELGKVKEGLVKMKSSGSLLEPEILQMDVSAGLDVLQPKVEALAEKYEGCIDILINNAGISFRGESFTSTESALERVMNVNFFGAVRLTNLIVSQMVKKTNNSVPRRAIVNIGSIQSYLATPYRSAYTASKHALLAYSDSLRAELYLHQNIDVINAQPGYINTNVALNALTADGVANNVQEDDHKDGYEPNYVARVVLQAIVSGQKELIISSVTHRLGLWLRFFLPNVYVWLMRKRARKATVKKYQS